MFRKLWEMNLSVIPVVGKKACVLNNWTQYCDRLATEQEIDEWERLYSNSYYGVGLCLGPATNLIAWDCDSDSPDILALAPPSPVIKFGSKGNCPFFINGGDIVDNYEFFRKNTGPNKLKKDVEGIEIFVNKRQVVLPPSMNPDSGKRYIYLTPDTLENFDFKDLPRLYLKDVLKAKQYIDGFEKVETNRGQAQVLGPGRNNRLTVVACAMLCNTPYKSDLELAAELMAVDIKEHVKPLFSDRDEHDCKRAKGDPTKAAVRFVERQRKQMMRKGMISEISQQSITVEEISANKSQPKEIKMPEFGGVIGDITNLILSVSATKQYDIALAAAITIVSVIAANRFKTQGRAVLTSILTICIAESGVGKGAIVKVVNKLLGYHGLGSPELIEHFNLMGIGNYTSVASLVNGLDKKRARLDLQDEFGKFLKGLNSGDHLKEAVGDALKEISTAGDFYNGHHTKTNASKDKDQDKNESGMCAFPALGLLGLIQPDVLVTNSKIDFINDGLMARFMYVCGENICDAEYLANEAEPICTNELNRIVDLITERFPKNPLIGSGPYAEKLLPTDKPYLCDFKRKELFRTEEFDNYFSKLRAEFHAKQIELKKQSRIVEQVLYSRLAERIERIAYCDCVSLGDTTVTVEHAQRAKAFVIAAHNKSKHLLVQTGLSGNEADVQKLLRIIAKAPEGYVSKTKISRHHRLSGNALKNAVAIAFERGQIQLVKDAGADVYALRPE